ncbi:MAG: hypothetical protein WCK55_21370 [Verrucomicrobiota bacterium]
MNTKESAIPSVTQFKEALLALRPLDDTQMKMLRAHYLAAEHRLTATQLAEAAGSSSHSTTNLHYGKLGRAVGAYLSFQPPQQNTDGSPLYTSVIASGEPGLGIADAAHYVWTMRPELVAALSELPWGFKPKI